MVKFDAQWWLETIPVRLDWWPGAEHFWYWHIERVNVVLLACAAVLVGVIFFLTCLKRSGIDIVINSLWR